jgi:hypothetical protein
MVLQIPGWGENYFITVAVLVNMEKKISRVKVGWGGIGAGGSCHTYGPDITTKMRATGEFTAKISPPPPPQPIERRKWSKYFRAMGSARAFGFRKSC